MSIFDIFIIRVRRFHFRYLAGTFTGRLVRWIPAGPLIGAIVYLLFVRSGGIPVWAAYLSAGLFPLFAAALNRHFGVRAALTWLDAETGGHQELQAAWENRSSAGPMASLVVSAGTRIIDEALRKNIVPRPGAAALLTAITSTAVLAAAALAGFALVTPPDRAVMDRGAELESWADAWAERTDGSGLPESRELARKMEDLGRRMADGELNELRSERALKRLEEEIQERQDELVRDRLADALVEELGIDRKSAELFRVRRRRLPADVLAELGGTAAGSSSLSDMDRDVLDKLLSDPDMRTGSGRGRRELTEKLTEALKDALDADDPRLRELADAAARGRAPSVEGGDSNEETDRPPAERPDGPSDPGSSPAGSGPAGAGPDEEEVVGRTGGGGRGDTPSEDSGPRNEQVGPSSAEDPMRLPGLTDRTGSWRTVIRAYARDELPVRTPDASGEGAWRRDVEAVMSSEDIPPGTRDLVRSYFLALEQGPADEVEESGDEKE